MKCIPPLQETNLEAMVIRFDELEDPDTFVRRHGADALWSKIEQAQPLVAWALDRILAPIEGGSVERSSLDSKSRAIAESSHQSGSWQHYAQEVSRRLCRSSPLLETIREGHRATANAHDAGGDRVRTRHRARPGRRRPPGVLMQHPEWIDDFLGDELDNMLSSQEVADFLHLASEHLDERDELNTAVLLEQVDSRRFEHRRGRDVRSSQRLPKDRRSTSGFSGSACARSSEDGRNARSKN